jgi:dsRNA-specific ribonuclease
VPEGCTAELNERLSQRRKMVLWIDKNVAPGENPTYPEWQSKAIVDREVVGVGYGGRIKIARNVAAYRALVALGLRDSIVSR